MQVQLGNKSPLANGSPVDLGAPAVTYIHIPDSYTFDPEMDLKDFAMHLVRNPDVTKLPENEALLVVTHPMGGAWRNHSIETPTFVWADNEAFQGVLADFFGCPSGLPQGLEDDYFTKAGPPGVVPGAKIDLQMNITQNGRDIWARALGGDQVGAIGVGTAATATTLTTGSTFTTNQWAGHRVVVYSTTGNNLVIGKIVSNTNAAGASVLTVDQWSNPSNPAGGAATTPTTPWAFVILDGNGPAWFMGLSASTTTLASPSTNTSLPGEITTGGGGLIRKICPYAHTASANTFTLTPVFTANGSDTLPVTIGSIGVFDSMVVSDATSTMLFNTLLTTTATLNAPGDQLTITETCTGT